jgi:hypothetical protein
MPIGQVIDLTEYADKLPVQYQNSFNLKLFISTFLEQVQELENASADLTNSSTDIDIAEGYQLDIIGQLIGAYRGELLDPSYRKLIKFKITTNTGSGTAEDVIFYLKFVLDSGVNVQIFEHPPASVYIHITGEVPTGLNLVEDLDRVLPAGVRVSYVSHAATTGVFTPYTQGSTIHNLLVDTGEQLEDNTGRPIVVRGYSQITDASTLAILAEFYSNANYGLSDNNGNKLVTDTGDSLQMYTFREAEGNVNLILPEVLIQ